MFSVSKINSSLFAKLQFELTEINKNKTITYIIKVQEIATSCSVIPYLDL